MSVQLASPLAVVLSFHGVVGELGGHAHDRVVDALVQRVEGFA